MWIEFEGTKVTTFRVLIVGHAGLALADEVFQLGELDTLGFARLDQDRQVSVGILVSAHLEGEVGASAIERPIAGVIAEGLLVDQEVPLQSASFRIPPIHEPGEPSPGWTIVAAKIQVPLERLFGLRQVIGGLGAFARSSKAEAFRCIWKPWTRCMPPPNRVAPTSSRERKTRLSLLIIPS